MSKYISTCPLDCFDICSLVVEVEEGRITNIEGNKEHPVTKGFICSKGKKHLERVYSPDRLKHPVLKTLNGWEQISWDRAFSIISDKLNKYKDQYGSLSIAQYNDGGAGGLLKEVENLFFDYLGDVTLFEGGLCWSAGIKAQQLDFGQVLGHTPEDLLNSKTIIIWGRNPADTNMHLMPYIKAARDNGAEVIVIDPIKTATVKYADKYIQVKPGGDCALACAAAKLIIEAGSVDNDFIKSSNGFDELKGYLESVDIQQLLQLSGASDVEARHLKDSLINKPTAIIVGYGLQRYRYGGAAVRAIDMLGAISGNIGIPGGGVNYANRLSKNLQDWDAVAPQKTPSHRYIKKPQMGKQLSQISDPGIKMMFISRSNPVIQSPNSNEIIKALQNIEFKVVLDHFMTDTAQLADLVLPVTFFLEEEDVIMSGMWNDSINYINKCVKPSYEAKPELEIYSELALRLGLTDFPQMTPQQWIERLMKPAVVKGLSLTKLKEKGYTNNPNRKQVVWGDRVFDTPSKKFEMLPIKAIKEYMDYELKIDNSASYSLISVHGKDSLHSQHYKDTDECFPTLYISKEDALSNSFEGGSEAEIYNSYGTMRVKLCISESCSTGVLYIKEGYWRKSGGSVNMLSPDILSDVGDQAIYNECRCSIKKI